MPEAATEPAVLSLVCPDWREQEHALRLPDPFVLWPVGDQPLLYHWFDHALDQGYKHVRVYVADRPHRVREAVKEATLWPIIIEVVTVSQADASHGKVMSGLPGSEAPDSFASEWELMDHWHGLDRAWLESTDDEDLDVNLSIGRLCRIHPSVKLNPPYFIGDYVAIGPGSVIGPNAVVGSGSLVAEDTVVRNARLMPHSFLGAHLTLENAILYGRVLYNCKNRARLERMESFIADSIAPPDNQVSWSERWAALWYWFKFRSLLYLGLPSHDARIALNGTSYPGLASLPLWLERLPWLWEAACGRMRLYGPLPRSDEQLETLPPDWQSILREAKPGAIAYSDCLGCHDPDDPTEALHAVYQVTHPEHTRTQCAIYLQQLTHH